jgi:hypothetical protein
MERGTWRNKRNNRKGSTISPWGTGLEEGGWVTGESSDSTWKGAHGEEAGSWQRHPEGHSIINWVEMRVHAQISQHRVREQIVIRGVVQIVYSSCLADLGSSSKFGKTRKQKDGLKPQQRTKIMRQMRKRIGRRTTKNKKAEITSAGNCQGK